MIAIPQAPAKRYPSHKNVNNLELGSKRILERLKPNSRVDATVRLAAQNNIPTGYRKLPQEARHVAAYLHQTSAQQRHATNLNRGLQTQLKRRLNNLPEGYRRQGIRHGSVLIADHTNAQIKAAMGSFNFEHRDAGQVIGFTDRRSVGSTLKPYIYALSLDRGLALPKMLVLTSPVNLVPIRQATMMANIGDWCPWMRR